MKTQFRVLYREFLFRIVDLELLAPQGDMSKLLGQFAAILVFISVGFTLMAGAFGPDPMRPLLQLVMTWSVQHILIATTMLVVGLFAVLSWDSTFPDRRDVMVLAPLPVRTSTLFLAKVAAVATALSVTILALHVPAGLVWPLAFASQGAITAPALTYAPALPGADAASFKSIMDGDIARDQPVPLRAENGSGLTIGVLKNGRRSVMSYGTARPDSIFEIGSISKTFTALLLADMVKQRRARLDEPVRELMPPGTVAKPAGAEITLFDLATHTSGLPRMPNNINPADRLNPVADYRAADLYAYMHKRGVAKLRNTSVVYSNLGFSLLGQTLADRAGLSYEEFVRRVIAEPLNMPDTVVMLRPEQKGRLIQGHDKNYKAVPAWDFDAMAGSGGIRSTAADMLNYLEAQLDPSKAATLHDAIQETHRLRAEMAPGLRIGLSWAYSIDSGTYWHNGGTGGYSSYAFFNPKGGYAGVVLLNVSPTLMSFIDLLGEHVRQRLAGEPAVSLNSVLIPAQDNVLATIRGFGAYWFTMTAAGVFVFCSVLGLQGLASQMLPRRYFLRLSSFLQIAAFCVFLCVYFLQPMAATPPALLAAQHTGLLGWSPSYWFLGLFQQLSGSPALPVLATRAWIGLGVVLAGTALAYVLSYMRTIRRIAEEPDIVPALRGRSWLPPFGSPVQTAVAHFSIRTLMRSRQHRVILSFFIGIGFAIVIVYLRSQFVLKQVGDAGVLGPNVNAPLLSATLVMMSCWILGARIVFAMPLDLRANWAFRIMPLRGTPDSLKAARRALYVIAVMPVMLGSAGLLYSIWPWQLVTAHLAALWLAGAILVEMCLLAFPKIPFTCSYLPGKSHVHIAFLISLGWLNVVVNKAAQLEMNSFQDPVQYATMIGLLGAAALLLRWRNQVLAASDKSDLRFEEAPEPAIFALDLHRDGAPPVYSRAPADTR